VQIKQPEYQKKAVIVTDKGVRKLGFADKVADYLKDAKKEDCMHKMGEGKHYG
jgi:alcohol dehydrogenase class IV